MVGTELKTHTAINYLYTYKYLSLIVQHKYCKSTNNRCTKCCIKITRFFKGTFDTYL